MSVVTYNNIQLPYSNTTQFQQEAIYEPSQTDRILTKFDISTQCLINSSFAAQLNPELGDLSSSPADFMAWVRQQLLTQRQTLSVQVNGVELIPQPQVGLTGSVDAKNGPLPQYCQIIALNDTLFIVNYRIIAHYWENYATDLFPDDVPITSTNLPGNVVLYNRWKESVTIDERNLTHRIRTGKFMIRSDNTEGFIPDQLRTQMAIVAVPVGFLRMKNQYTVTEDGLGMEYVQEDQEVCKLPPVPAFKAEGTFTVATSKNTTALATCRVRLQGDATQPIQDNQLTLVFTAIQIVQSKLLEFPQWSLIQNATLTIDLYDNIVEFQQTILVAKSNIRLLTAARGGGANQSAISQGGLDFFAQVSTFTPLSDAGRNLPGASQPVYKARGTAGLLLQAAAYFDPNLQDTILGIGDEFPTNDLFIAIPEQVNITAQQLDEGVMPGQGG